MAAMGQTFPQQPQATHRAFSTRAFLGIRFAIEKPPGCFLEYTPGGYILL
jgi:hypothetical protein